MAYCQRCGGTGAYPRNYESPNGSKATMNHCNSCYRDVARYFQNEWSDFRKRVEEEKEKAKKKQEDQEKAEQEKKINEWKASHCAKCGKYSNVYHYIYDKDTNKLTQSFDNASNPNKQWVFCTEDHFREWEKEQKYMCRKCGKKGFGGYIYKKGNEGNFYERFCSSKCYQYYYAEDCDNCGCKATGKSYYRDTTNWTGTLCGNCYELKELEEQLAELNVPTICQECKKSGTAAEMDWHNPNVNDGKKFCSKSCCLSHYAEKCDTCSKKIGENEKSYYQDAKSKSGTLCASCWQTKKNKTNSSPTNTEEETKEKPVSSNSPTNNRNDSPNQPSPTNNSPSSFNSPTNGSNSNGTSYLDCPFCQKRVYSEEECNQHFQDSLDCQKKQEIMEPIAEKIENNESILDVNVDNLGLSQEMTITLKAVQRIQRGEKVDIDGLNISEEAKKQLRNIKSLKNYQREESNSDPEIKAEKPFFHQPWVIIGAIIILLFTLIIVIRNSKVKNRRKSK